MSIKAALKALRNASRADPQIDDIRPMENELFSIGSDRATAVMFGAFSEQNLRTLLEKNMRSGLNSDETARVFGDRGIAGSFSAKITAAWAFNIIGPVVRSDLDIIREIRNTAAHSRLRFSFDKPELTEVCNHLKIISFGGAYVPFNYLEGLSSDERERAKDFDYPKTKFITSCHLISYRMHQKVHGPVAGDIAFQGELLP